VSTLSVARYEKNPPNVHNTCHFPVSSQLDRCRSPVRLVTEMERHGRRDIDVDTFLIGEARVPVVADCHSNLHLACYDPSLSFCSFHVFSIMDDMDVDNAPTTTKAGKEKDNGKKRFEVKKVSRHRRGVISNDPNETFSGTQSLSGRGVRHPLLYDLFECLIKILDIVVDNCAICRNHIMDLCSSTILPRRCL
jgi:hypothetical protein